MKPLIFKRSMAKTAPSNHCYETFYVNTKEICALLTSFKYSQEVYLHELIA